MRKLQPGLLVAGMLVLITTAAGAEEPGAACRQACENELRANGTWNKLPYGTCRKRCGMPYDKAAAAASAARLKAAARQRDR